MNTDLDKVSKVHAELIKVFQKYSLNVGELLLVYGNLGYTLGASVDGHQGTGPSIQELKEAYYTQPTVGVALMLQGIEVTTWHDDLVKLQNQEKEKDNGNT